MIEVNDTEYLRILMDLVAEVTEKETKLEYLESSSLVDPYLNSHREQIERQKKTIQTLVDHLSEKLAKNACRNYVSGIYQEKFVVGTYIGDYMYKFEGEHGAALTFSAEFIDVNMQDAHYFDDLWVLELLILERQVKDK